MSILYSYPNKKKKKVRRILINQTTINIIFANTFAVIQK